jgi:hypothetical protein
MEFSPKDLLSPKDVMSEVLIYTQEMGYKNVTRGFIISQMNRCMRALSYDTFFNESHKTFLIPDNRMIDIPAGVFNINQMYLYNGDTCNIGSNTANVYWKRNMYTGGGNGYAARNKGNNGNNGQDPFYTSFSPSTPEDRSGSRINTPGTNLPNSLYYYGESNGQIVLSENTGPYSKLLIKFNGIWEVDEEKNTIPEYFQEVLVDWCTESVLRVKSAVEPVNSKWRSLHSDSVFRLGYKPETYDGSWYKAKRRVTSMGNKKKEDLKEYLSRLNS